MRFKNSRGIWRSPAASDIARIGGRIRAWRHAGMRFALAEDLLRDLDEIERRHPRLIRRCDCLRSYVTGIILDSIVMIPNSPSVIPCRAEAVA